MKTKFLIVAFFLIVTNITGQTQLGSNLSGEDMSNLSGRSIAINNDGNFIAVGAPRAIIAINGGIAIRGGHVRTYAFNGTEWTVGADFDAEEKGDSMGFSVAVNGDGSVIACAAPEGDPNGTNSGYVHVYLAQGDNPITPNFYIRLGEDLDGESSVDRFGQSIAINDAGTRLIVGAPGGNYVKVFQKETFADPWAQLGSKLSGDANGDLFGTSVDINAAGDRIVVGAMINNGGGSGAGRAKVYELVNGDWVQLGGNIDGKAGDQAGNSVSIDDLGDTVAIGFPGLAAPGINNSGAVKIFDLVNDSWQQKGNSIIGRAFEALGGSGNNQQEGAIDLHAGGTRIAIGSKTYTNQNVTQSGFIAHYVYDRGVWSKSGDDVVGSANGDEFGAAVAINDSDGTIIAGGAAFADANGNDSGYSAVYDFKNVLSVSSSEIGSSNYSIYPNPSNTLVNILGDTIKQVDVINLQGKIISTSYTNILDVTSFNTGVYIVRINKGENSFIYKKLLVE